jgi:hypothetical protein
VTNVIGLDGVERTWDETFVFNAGQRDAENVAYVVRRTFFDGRAHEDVARFDLEPEFLAGRYPCTRAYGRALDCANTVRAEGPDNYAVVDRVYADGTRING